MKNKFKYILVSCITLFLIISIINENISFIVESLNLLDSKQCMESDDVNEEDKKIIYLTFDDGPSYKVTSNVLDILKENEVKATFFLIGSQIKDKEDVVKRIYNEGHSIGLHTYTHNFRKIYCNEDRFIQEMIFCRSEIQEVIGVAPNIIRFPGGSYKHLSKNYLKKLHDNNFRVYDWNMDNCDGLNPKIQPYNLYRRAIKGSDKLDNIILLLHCTDMNKNTCKALPKIIKYYKSQGYEFKRITDETAELYFPIKR
ncbi:polysaccharide deacetylase family protein [Clostridium beijerinckii]|uniref:Polysaccharide deacetylase n=1 Tax=Clostridium beijerinckii TaxID=1520 RepID=A0A1S9N5C2_CLOBE|nr:polysaccharide deacetylase family protein [Clostridium beijerinckii]MZK51104.1 polysaccharide deacetylase family protein [Clostridium beijerinckii]MZK59306.1 polysaccharide deacetylase family protein [Clostridium beijerinckii]MZK69425.1 polysaccharide deacetylase family protein [Clostridium beijerinckii]MZK74798.1 polysaccharide deacetylase family protein [Clostridium beijerinckii]MZK84516.1 polysaccharide deacetylase family protein [Clostridium beijerinckii]